MYTYTYVYIIYERLIPSIQCLFSGVYNHVTVSQCMQAVQKNQRHPYCSVRMPYKSAKKLYISANQPYISAKSRIYPQETQSPSIHKRPKHSLSTIEPKVISSASYRITHRYLGRKDSLAKGVEKFKRANGAKSFPYLPKTYLLPDDRDKLIADWKLRDCRSRCGKGVAVWCSVLQCGAVCCSLLWSEVIADRMLGDCRSSVMQCVAVRCSVVQCCSVLCCNMLQRQRQL